MKALVWEDDTKPTDYVEKEIPAELKEKAEEYRTKMIEAVSETSDELMEKYLGGEELSLEEIKTGIKAGCLSLSIVPMLCGTAFKNKGVQPLLDVVRLICQLLMKWQISRVNMKMAQKFL